MKILILLIVTSLTAMPASAKDHHDLPLPLSSDPLIGCVQHRKLEECTNATIYYSDYLSKKRYSNYDEFCHASLLLSAVSFEDGILGKNFREMQDSHKVALIVADNCFEPWESRAKRVLRAEDATFQRIEKRK